VLKAQIGDAWSAYQDSRYARATRLLPPVIAAARNAVNSHTGEAKATAQGLLAMAYQGAAMVLTKVGETDLAWLAADRGLSAANQSDNVLICGSLYRSVAHCLLATAQVDAGRLDAAVGVVDNATSFLSAATDRSNPSHLSIYGTLLLVGSMAAARAGDRPLRRATSVKRRTPREASATTVTTGGRHSGRPRWPCTTSAPHSNSATSTPP
jgi:hypothetical protein